MYSKFKSLKEAEYEQEYEQLITHAVMIQFLILKAGRNIGG